MKGQYVVTGASRGLGLELCRNRLAAGCPVAAMARDPAGSPGLRELGQAHGEDLVVLSCDVGDDASVAAAFAGLAERWDAVDVLVNNAGVSGATGSGLESLDLDDLREVFEINTLGALRATRACLPMLRRGRRRLVVHMTSLMGSLADNQGGGSYGYRISKTALNMASRNLAHELRDEGITSVLLHPGWVRTDMGGASAPLGISESIAALTRTIEALGLEHSGGFFDREGEPLPW